jgi:hypothetical protein
MARSYHHQNTPPARPILPCLPRILTGVFLATAGLCAPPAGADTLPHTAKPLLLDLLDTCRGDWQHPAWLGQQMNLDGPVTGLFALQKPLADSEIPRLGVVLTPSGAPDDWDQARVEWLTPDAGGRHELGRDDHWNGEVTLTRVSPRLVRADLTKLRCNQAFMSPDCLAGLVLETSGGALAPFVLMPVGDLPTYRLETDAVGHMTVGKRSVKVRVLGYNPLDTTANGGLVLRLRDKLTGEIVSRTPVPLILSPGAFETRQIDVKLPRFGVFEADLVPENAGNAEDPPPLASLRLTRVPEPRRHISPDDSSFGINVFQHQFWWHALQAPLLHSMGAKWVRPWLAWENTWRMQEPEPGRYDFTHLDNAITRLERLGMAYENILFASPERVGGSGLLQTPPPPDKLHLWEDWVRALALRFRGRIRHYEVWNEPDMMWPGTAGEHADAYVQLLETTRRVLLETDPDAVVHAPSSAGYRRWLQETARLGARDLTDVFTFHVYTPPGVLNHHMRMRLDLWGGAEGWDKPVWLNEIGNAACDLNPAFNEQVMSNELNQAQVLVGDSTLFLAERPEGKVFWFCSLDPHDPFNPSSWLPDGAYPGDAATGLLYEGYLPKLGFVAHAAMARELDGRRALGQWNPARGVHVVAFEDRRAVVFHDDLAESSPFPATDIGCDPYERLTVLDMFGNLLQRGRASELSLDCSRGPLYIRGSARLAEIAAVHGALARLRPPCVLASGEKSDRSATLPQDAEVAWEVLQEGQILEAAINKKGRVTTLSINAAPGVDHALAYVRLGIDTAGQHAEEVFPATVGSLSLFDAPGYTFDPGPLCTREREGGIDWSPTEGHLAPGCLVVSAPWNARLVAWQHWYLGLRPDRPIRWSVWLKAEDFGGAQCSIALAQFGDNGWLGDRILAAPADCPSGNSDWVRVTGGADAADHPDGLESMALYVDVSTPDGTVPTGRLLIDELDIWQPGE